MVKKWLVHDKNIKMVDADKEAEWLGQLQLKIYGMAGTGKTDMESAANMLMQIHDELRNHARELRELE